MGLTCTPPNTSETSRHGRTRRSAITHAPIPLRLRHAAAGDHLLRADELVVHGILGRRRQQAAPRQPAVLGQAVGKGVPAVRAHALFVVLVWVRVRANRRTGGRVPERVRVSACERALHSKGALRT
jgi:hypothetical protein